MQGVTISNDGATIMRLLDIVHPAAKTLVNISMSQDAEVHPFCNPFATRGTITSSDEWACTCKTMSHGKGNV